MTAQRASLAPGPRRTILLFERILVGVDGTQWTRSRNFGFADRREFDLNGVSDRRCLDALRG
jgi:hypothetical protein